MSRIRNAETRRVIATSTSLFLAGCILFIAAALIQFRPAPHWLIFAAMLLAWMPVAFAALIAIGECARLDSIPPSIPDPLVRYGELLRAGRPLTVDSGAAAGGQVPPPFKHRGGIA